MNSDIVQDEINKLLQNFSSFIGVFNQLIRDISHKKV
jgi:hypothetical protein